MEDTILVQRDAAIATVVLNRPDKLNALTRAMWQRLGQVFVALSADDDLRCIILRGAGTRAFAPGNDIAFENKAEHDTFVNCERVVYVKVTPKQAAEDDK